MSNGVEMHANHHLYLLHVRAYREKPFTHAISCDTFVGEICFKNGKMKGGRRAPGCSPRVVSVPAWAQGRLPLSLRNVDTSEKVGQRQKTYELKNI
jgi:hypothetical protein